MLLTGSPGNPVIENRSGKTVIAYTLKKTGRNGRGPVHQMLLAFSVQPAGFPDGGSLYVRGNVIQSTSNRPGPIVSATLQNVVFDDGQFVGTDEHGNFERFGKRMQAIREVGMMTKSGAWDQVEVLAQALTQLSLRPPAGEDPTLYFDRRVAAERLTQERKQKGDAAAAQLAEIYRSLPTLWK